MSQTSGTEDENPLQDNVFVCWHACCAEFTLDIHFSRISVFDACRSHDTSNNAWRPPTTDSSELLCKPAVRRELKTVVSSIRHQPIVAQVRTLGI
ncbi:hypothetical protein LK08_04565 [Streptomyces sp. MUSC 125]|nr:hypothetical protein LK08_04565 [Streptomyces sp. MUSC 125]